MKLHCSKILLFLLPLNILVTSLSNVHSKNKPYITPRHTPTTTSRVLRECDIQTSIYNNDEEIKSVKENFHKQTEQRFHEYEERIKDKRQKCKEQRDKNIQEIIEKDRMDKSLAEKVEKGCLMCGCGLGGVAASVGLFGGFGIYGWKSAALAAAEKEGALAGEAVAKAAGAAAGKEFVIAELGKLHVSTLDNQTLVSYFATTDYTNFKTIALAINEQYNPSSCILPIGGSGPSETFCTWVKGKFYAAQEIPGKFSSTYKSIEIGVTSIVTDAKKAAETAVKKATDEAIQRSTAAVESTYASCQSAIIASVVAIVVIALVMIIIYLVLRYRRKKKMKKKAQYTKLLNE